MEVRVFNIMFSLCFLRFFGCGNSTNQVITYNRELHSKGGERQNSVSTNYSNSSSSDLNQEADVTENLLKLSYDEIIKSPEYQKLIAVSEEDQFIMDLFSSRVNGLECSTFIPTFKGKRSSKLKKNNIDYDYDYDFEIFNLRKNICSSSKMNLCPYKLTTYGISNIRKVSFEGIDDKYHTYILFDFKKSYLIVCFDDGKNIVQLCLGTLDELFELSLV